jgi:hypothetical protein
VHFVGFQPIFINLYLLCREKNDPELKTYYKNYCKILRKVIITAKKNFCYTNQLSNSENKSKMTWSIIKQSPITKTMSIIYQ